MAAPIGAAEVTDWAAYSVPALMNATSTSPSWPEAITGCDDGPTSPASAWTGAWKAPLINRETNTWATPATFLT